MNILIEVSGRHIHLSRNDLDVLFGKNYQLTSVKKLSQPNEFVCAEKVILLFNNKELSARIVGPLRKQTQVEISQSDADDFGVNVERKLSGDLQNSAGITIKGLKSEIILDSGVILAQRHIHCDEKTALQNGLTDGQRVKVKYNDYIFDNVIARISKNFFLAMHIDKDEAKEAGIDKTAAGEIII